MHFPAQILLSCHIMHYCKQHHQKILLVVLLSGMCRAAHNAIQQGAEITYLPVDYVDVQGQLVVVPHSVLCSTLLQ